MTTITAVQSAYRVADPATGDVLEAFDTATNDEIEAAIASAAAAAQRELGRSVADRIDALHRTAQLLRERRTELAEIAVQEIGKSLAQAEAEVDFAADIFGYYASNAPQLTADQLIPTAGTRAVIERRPLGVLLGIMPWNYPYYQVARFAAPNLAVGNTVLLKPAEWCPRSALALQAVLHEAGVPQDVYTTLLADHEQIRTVIEDPRVAAVSLTGSERAGAAVAEIAGAALKKVVLELGGSDAYVILDTESISEAAATAWGMRMENMGQACNSNKRIIIAADIFDEFVVELTSLASGLRPGNPLRLADDEYAPLAARSAAERLAQQVQDAVAKGATLHAGGQLGDPSTGYFAPAALTGVTPDMRAYREELFGPVAVVYRAADEAEALRLANDTDFGLGAAVFSQDVDRAVRFARTLDTGMVSINAPAAEGADLPFGGVKRSGFGRELGPLGIDEFVNKRLLYMQ